MSEELAPDLPPRIVHLLGGLRAVDDRGGKVWLQIGAKNRFGSFSTPEYAQLYVSLKSLGLTPIGVEFVNAGSYRGVTPPDWALASPNNCFQVREERHAWSEIRHAALDRGDRVAASIASRAKSYLDLLSIRILQLSNAYNQMLRAWHSSKSDRVPDRLFSSMFMPYLDAAIHAFVADAACFRDLIAEAVWTQILKGGADVTTLSTFLKKTANSTDPVAMSIIAAGAPGGWLKIFSELRNQVTHVAPVGRAQSFHSCEARRIAYCDSVTLIALHYPLLAEDGQVRVADDDALDFNDQASVLAHLEDYRAYFATSLDGLEYAWRTVGQLVDLLRDVRLISNLPTKQMVITKDDIVGEIRRT